MDRQSANGFDRDVARWLKQMGYRGQGLKKENLQPLCQGPMRDVLEGVIERLNPEHTVRDMKRTVDRRLQKGAADASRQLSKESALEFRRRRRNVTELESKLATDDARIERSRIRKRRLQEESMKPDVEYTKKKTEMDGDLSKAKILDAFSIQLEAATESMEQSMAHVRTHNDGMKAALQREGDNGSSAVAIDGVMKSIHEGTRKHFTDACRSTTTPPSETVPTFEDDQILTEIGKLYAEHGSKLVPQLAMACNRAQLKLAHHEAKYESMGQWRASDDGPQTQAVMDYQTCHIASFLALKRSEEEMTARMNELKMDASIMQLKAEIDRSGSQKTFDRLMERQCLQAEIERAQKEVEDLEREVAGHDISISQFGEKFRQLERCMEQQHQTDGFIEHLMPQLRDMMRTASEISTDATDKIENGLLPITRSCLDALRPCEVVVGEEVKAFNRYDVSHRVGRLTQPADDGQRQNSCLLERWRAAARQPSLNESDDYWTASIKTLFDLQNVTSPLLSIESPDAIFDQASNALRSAVCNAYIDRLLHCCLSQMHSAESRFRLQNQRMIEQNEEHESQTRRSLEEIDALGEQGRIVRTQLDDDARQALDALKNIPGLGDVPGTDPVESHPQDWKATQPKRH